MATKFATPSDIDNKTIVLNSDNKLEIAYTSNALIGPGRPDDPSTTNGVIKGTETDGMMYQSTDGAGVGAFLWQRVNYSNFMRFTPYKEGATGNPTNDWIPDVGPTNLRPQAMVWTTDEPFPTKLP